MWESIKDAVKLIFWVGLIGMFLFAMYQAGALDSLFNQVPTVDVKP